MAVVVNNIDKQARLALDSDELAHELTSSLSVTIALIT
jgi:hypothetical protein